MHGIWAAAKISPEAPDAAGGGSAGGGGESGPSSCVCCHAKAKPGCVHQTCRLCCVKLQRVCALTETEMGLTQVLPPLSPSPPSQPSAGEVLAAIHVRWTEAVGSGRAPSATCRVHRERGAGDRQQQRQQPDDRERTTPWRFDPQWLYWIPYFARHDLIVPECVLLCLVMSGTMPPLQQVWYIALRAGCCWWAVVQTSCWVATGGTRRPADTAAWRGSVTRCSCKQEVGR